MLRDNKTRYACDIAEEIYRKPGSEISKSGAKTYLRIHLDLQLIKQGYYSKLQLHKLFPKKYPGSKIRKACFEICPATLSQT
jgi:hypothetical protein